MMAVAATVVAAEAAERIGIARGTLYHHFASKEEILDALVERMTGEAIARARAVVSDKNSPVLDRLSSAVIAMNIDIGAGTEVLHRYTSPRMHCCTRKCRTV